MKLSKIYDDQAPHNSMIGGKSPRTFSATYTRGGIWHLSNELMIMIMLCSNKTECNYVMKKVHDNPHLHPMLKDKLLKHVSRKRRAMPKGKADQNSFDRLVELASKYADKLWENR